MTVYRIDRRGWGATVCADGTLLRVWSNTSRAPEDVAQAMLAHHFELNAVDRSALDRGTTPPGKAGKRVGRIARVLGHTILTSFGPFEWTTEQLEAFIALTPTAWEPGDLAWFDAGKGWMPGSVESVTRTSRALLLDVVGPTRYGDVVSATVGLQMIRHRDKARAGADRPKEE